MRKLTPFAVAGVLALALAGCSNPTVGGDTQSGNADMEEGVALFDVESIEPVADIVAMVPESVASTGVLRNGASTDYAPAEFRLGDGQTPTGYDIEIVRALARVMGLEGQTQHAEFATIIPQLGSKFDVGASSFTITPERIEQVNMVSYLEAGSAYAVAAGNPSKFDPEDPCGSILGVQTGTYQYSRAQEMSEECVAAGKDPIEVMPLDLQTDVTLKVIGGQFDATFADSPVIAFAVANSGDDLEQVGEIVEAEPQGIAISKDDEQLTAAVQAAMQHLMDEGYLAQILNNYGAADSALTQAQVNP